MEGASRQDRKLMRDAAIGALAAVVLAGAGFIKLVRDELNGAQRPTLGPEVPTTTESTAEIGTALVSYSLACEKSGERVLDTFGADKEVQITVPSMYSQTGYFTLGFKQDKGGYRLDMPGYEDLTVREENLPEYEGGFIQSININEDFVAVFRLFKALDDVEGRPGMSTFIEAQCMSQLQAEQLIRASNPLTTQVDMRPL